MNEEANSKWRRDAKAASALRLGDRVSLVLGKDTWRATLPDGVVSEVRAAPVSSALEDAIRAADASFPPPGWTHSDGRWVREGWAVRPAHGGWYVYRTAGGDDELASVQEFASPDRARRWAEVRLDRTGTNLRGPKPRAGRRSNCKLPDVRVTESERAETLALLEELGLTYSQFVRAAVRFASTHILAGEWTVDSSSAPVFVGPDTGGSEQSEERVPSGSEPQEYAGMCGPDNVESTLDPRLAPYSIFTRPAARVPWVPPEEPEQ